MKPDLEDENETIKGFIIERVRAPFERIFQDSVIKFMYSLTVEQEFLILTQDQVLSSKELFVIKSTNEDDKIVGVGGLLEHRFHNLFFMVVNKNYQGIGLGKKLIKDITSTIGTCQLTLLTVHRSNVDSRRLYKTYGFMTIFRHRILATMVYKNKIGRWFKGPLICWIYIKSLFD